MNRLAGETSPYLLQHRHNPVDWYPWGEEALTRARELDRPLLVSIGYSACHWCHVMERESFEDEAVAAYMNAHFVCIKVDREERPDVDAVCMEACQAFNGHGGWPLNVFLTPEQQPFYAGTYFPPQQRPGMPSWPTVLESIADAWAEKPQELRGQGAQLAEAIARHATVERAPEGVAESVVDDAITALQETFDPLNGGWGAAPKFPSHGVHEFLMAAGAPALALETLRAMARGGIYDQVGGGFARYAVDATWTVPHFEKMLYDNALLARAYLHGWQLSGEQRLLDVCTETLDWALRELRGPEGGFCAALDADSEGVEGRFYVWTLKELEQVLDDLAPAAIAYFGVSQRGNFEHGNNVLEARGPVPEQLPQIRHRLLEARSHRVRPGLDDKRLTAWNALMLTALADAGATLDRTDYLDAARACADFLLEHSRGADGRLQRTWKDGEARIDAYLDDHAYLLQALLVLYEATFEPRWYTAAVQIAQELIARFGDTERGGFFTTAEDHEHLVVRRKDLEDSPTPSGNSAAALGLLRLARLSGDSDYARWAGSVMALHGPLAARYPSAFGHLLQAIDLYLSPAQEIAILGEPSALSDAGGPAGPPARRAAPLTRAVRGRFLPHAVIAGAARADESAAVPLLAGREPVDGRPAAYVCERFACQLPVTEVAALEALLA
jgi:uncharacterized protein YyaL (SSP411 family)